MHENSRDRRRQRRAAAAAALKPAATTAVSSMRTRIAGDLGAYLHRFPKPGGASLAFSLASIVLGNGYLLWLISQERLGVSALILMILIEGVLLSLIETAQREFVPPEHRMAYDDQGPGGPAQKVLVWTAFVIAMAGAYGLWIHVNGDTHNLLAHLTTLEAWQDSGLHVAIGITLLFAVAGLFADHRHYRRAGPPLVSSVSMEAMARRMTFIYGAMVFVIPLLALLALAFVGVMSVFRRLSDRWNLLGGLCLFAPLPVIFFGLTHIGATGPLGWCFVYLLGKVMVETLFALMPLLAEKRLEQKRRGRPGSVAQA